MVRLVWLGMAVTVLAACTSMPDSGQQTLASGGKIGWTVAGAGKPVVVLQSGLGDDRSAWSKVFPDLAAHYRVFAYDRPGYGSSSSASTPRDPCTIAAELHDLLRAAQVPPPYLLVGHSIGGMYQYVYARMYPDEVAGLVLVDATHPDHWRNMQTQSSTQASLLKGMRLTVFTPAMRPEFDDQDKCLDQIARSPALGKPVRVLVRTRYDLMEQGSFEQQVHQEEADWLVLTGASKAQPVNSGHYIQNDQPAAVLNAVAAVAAQAGY
ncbi:alpha/beta fold hydrolase [Silvimonas iriomotensis]|uniref:AB hydrolase-1 domain-containing protein n=1 Tax=Silvimonas iriomotensis TaxID=449662 RepID=A0ABQ2P5X6_9NEIS|nr:alpha/beta hydrolase [Silvimonas iriomotensis]GGP18947.1 hypothetical protein GCM10010970_08180 [Silvimonas iriomotensis]